MSNITGNAPSTYFPSNSTVVVGDDGKICVNYLNPNGFSETSCFNPTPGLRLNFAGGGPSDGLVGEKPKDTGTINQPPSTQQLMDSLIQMLQQLVTQIKGNLPIGGKA